MFLMETRLLSNEVERIQLKRGFDGFLRFLGEKWMFNFALEKFFEYQYSIFFLGHIDMLLKYQELDCIKATGFYGHPKIQRCTTLKI